MHKTRTPPIIFMILALINSIPGGIGYKFLMGITYWISNNQGKKLAAEDSIQIFSYGISTVIMLFSFGVAFSVIAFKSISVKGKDLNVLFMKNYE